jgi:hypothetical protein
MAATALIIGATTLAAAGTAFSAYQQYQNAQGQKAAAQYNADVQRQAGLTATNTATARETEVRRRSAIALGEQFAAASQAGIGMGPSTRGVLRDSAIAAELDALNTRYAGQLERRNLMAGLNLSRFNALQFGRAGTNALIGGGFGIGSQILGGVGDYMKWVDPTLGGLFPAGTFRP